MAVDRFKPLSAEMLLENGVCCGRGCTNCVYYPRHEKGNKKVDWNFVLFSSLVPEATYELYREILFGDSNKKLYLTIGLDERGRFSHSLERERPLLGGYWSEKKYGNPRYCPSATRVHKKRIAETGVSPNLIYFASVKAAVAAGFSPCGNCWLKGRQT